MKYFKTLDFGNGVFMLWELLGVASHLILGNDKALLIDTGYGVGNIAKAVEALTAKPLIVANTHVHPDHSMGNRQFERVLVGKGDMGRIPGLKGEFKDFVGFIGKYMPPAKLLIKQQEKMEKRSLPETEYEPLSDGQLISLGGRDVEVMEMPGHTKGSVAFLDKSSKTLFAGDAINKGMFLYFDKDAKLAAYAGKLEKLHQLAESRGLVQIRTSHSQKALDLAFILYYASLLRRVDASKCKSSPMPLAVGKVLRYTEKSRQYGSVSVFFHKGQERG
jgi:glyoxylase-like metal-dependent hydrolase (beta-lactamase superfamily II)